MTINLFPPQKETPAAIEMIQKLEGNRLAEFQKEKIIDRPLPSNDGCPRMLIEYEAGEGIPKEHAAGGFLKLIPTTVQLLKFRPVESRSTRATRQI